MARIAVCAMTVLPMGLLLAGCAGGHESATRTGPNRVARRDTAPTTRPGQLLGYTIGPDQRYDVDLDEIRERVQNHRGVIVDARSPASFKRGHVRGAVNLPAGELDTHFGQFSQSVGLDESIILYCSGPDCNSADMVFEYLVSKGYSDMRVFRPGWETLSEVSDLR